MKKNEVKNPQETQIKAADRIPLYKTKKSAAKKKATKKKTPKPPKETIISNNIKVAREYRGYTQTDFAKLLNCSQGQISCMENGRYSPRISTIIRMSCVLQVRVASLLGVEDAGLDYADLSLLEETKDRFRKSPFMEEANKNER